MKMIYSPFGSIIHILTIQKMKVKLKHVLDFCSTGTLISEKFFDYLQVNTYSGLRNTSYIMQ